MSAEQEWTLWQPKMWMPPEDRDEGCTVTHEGCTVTHEGYTITHEGYTITHESSRILIQSYGYP